MMNYDFGDIILVPFPFTDQTGTKKRPAVIVSSSQYNSSRQDLVLMAITSQIKKPLRFGEIEIVEWQTAGLLKSSVIKPVLTTIENKLVLRGLGKLEQTDTINLRNTLSKIFG